jgi:hypothetical protein
LLRRLFTIMCRDIGKIDITPNSLPIPTEHGVDSFRQLYAIPLINTAGVYPEVVKTISRSLVRAELYLLPPSLALPGARLYILKADLFLVIYQPGMGEDCIGWDVFVGGFVKDEVAVGFALQDAHREA